MNNVRSKRGPYARSLKRRETIAQTVLEIVDREGYETVTTALVAERSGSNESTVLYHFPTKDHLLLAALKRADDLAAEKSGFSEGHERAEVDPSALDGLAMSVDFPLLRDASPRGRLAHLLRGLAAAPEHPAAEYFAERDSRTVAIFTRIIAARQGAGLVHPGLDPADVATQFVALWHGLGAMSSINGTIEANRLLDSGLRMLSGEAIVKARSQMLELP